MPTNLPLILIGLVIVALLAAILYVVWNTREDGLRSAWCEQRREGLTLIAQSQHLTFDDVCRVGFEGH